MNTLKSLIVVNFAFQVWNASSGILPLMEKPNQATGDLVTYDWPTASGEAMKSEQYRVWAKLGNRAEQEIVVLCSDAIYEGGEYVDGEAADLKGRTFSFAQVGYNPACGEPLTFRVEKIFGDATTKVSLAPRSYGLTPESNGREVVFQITNANRYVSVDFEMPDNRTVYHGWIKHMLCVFVDPKETDAPNTNDAGVVIFNPQMDAKTLNEAKVIYFAPGYYNLKGVQKPGSIEGEGKLILRDGQSAYLAGGAFVEAHVDYEGTQQKLFGRGVLSGRQYIWRKDLKDRRSLVRLGDAACVAGITIMESPLHGVVSGRDCVYEDLKFLGWHWNNDGFRPNSRTKIRNCFMRCADDFFYNYALDVRDCVLWPGHNGAILTFGWGSYKLGGSRLENIDIINPEWVSLQNNNGLVMAQNQFDFHPTGPTTVLHDIRIEGAIPGLLNMHPRTEKGKLIAKPLTDKSKLGYVGDVWLENVTVDHQFAKGSVAGATNAVVGGGIFYVKNVVLKNVRIGGACVTDQNKREFLQIDDATTKGIQCLGCED
jgi:hypothetical protein